MKLRILRYSSGVNDTLGMLFIDDKFSCYTLEDEYRTKKVYGKTRIPEGSYEIKLRKTGGFHQRYLKKFGSGFHKGMLQIINVPNFKYVLIHIGNKEDDTAGCLLVGNTSKQNITDVGFIGQSTSAYKRIYSQIVKAIENKEKINITYKTI